MGILLNAAYLMMVEGNRRPFSGTVLQLGKQSVLFSYPSLKVIADHAKFQLADIGIDQTSDRRLTDVEFFKLLGFDDVKAMEYGTSEGADYLWDMNNPVPYDLHRRFDCIYDGGTIEHIFHIPNCMDSICRMVKDGGRVVHDGGVSGMIDHGFYSIQPTLYNDFYKANGFEINLATISKLNLATWLTHTGVQTKYEPGMYDYHKTWANEQDAFYVGVSFATKKESYSSMVIPQQSLWSRQSEHK